mmetsp:Transcript_14517/g.47383  ORF Transcript_14517/g.47383 Transcript_14517/m.47383 type:complete len:234 (+) Transcript_14517:255-956(+)
MHLQRERATYWSPRNLDSMKVSSVRTARIRSTSWPSPMVEPCALCTTVAQPGEMGMPVRVTLWSSSKLTLGGMGTQFLPSIHRGPFHPGMSITDAMVSAGGPTPLACRWATRVPAAPFEAPSSPSRPPHWFLVSTALMPTACRLTAGSWPASPSPRGARPLSVARMAATGTGPPSTPHSPRSWHRLCARAPCHFSKSVSVRRRSESARSPTGSWLSTRELSSCQCSCVTSPDR